MEGSAKNGHPIHLMYQQFITIMPTGVLRLHVATAATLIRRTQQESGAIQWIRVSVGNTVTFQSVFHVSQLQTVHMQYYMFHISLHEQTNVLLLLLIGVKVILCIFVPKAEA